MIASELERIPPIPQCAHEDTRICRRRQSNGVIVFVRQCVRCGYNRGAVAKHSPEVLRLAEIPDWDEELREAWERQWTDYQEQRRRVLDATIPGTAEWWKQYNEYLRSAAWRRKRQIALERDNYTCQGCLQTRATQVHHLSYKHMGNELLFELVSVCDACHQRIHPEMENV